MSVCVYGWWVCVFVCVCVSEFFTGLMDQQGVILPISVSHPQGHVFRLPASSTALLQIWLISAENS